MITSMLQAHSFLWHYLWIGPNLLLLGVTLSVWQRGLHRQFPAFFAFTILGAFDQLSVYAADIVPRVTPLSFWKVFWAALLVEAILKFFVLGEIFIHVAGQYPSLGRIGGFLIRAVGVFLVFGATLVAAYAPRDGLFGIVSGAHLLEQTIYLLECGILLFIFVFAAYYHLRWNRMAFGIALGLSFSACVHLADWALSANGLLAGQRHLLDFINMGSYHVSVLIWLRYALASSENHAPDDRPVKLAAHLPELKLQELNHELEQLLHR